MDLESTYKGETIHTAWESVYRHNQIHEYFDANIIDKIIKSFNMSPDALFLDAGCGTGGHLLRIAR
jgi:cyclopropane fatty-acyl-phospholipid synthase-like methyltransferase